MRKMNFIKVLMILVFTLSGLNYVTGLNSCISDNKISGEQEKNFTLAAKNGVLVNEALTRNKRYVDAWVPYADPKTGLIPDNIFKDKKDNDVWDIHNAAADNYPFMVLTSSFTDTNLFKGRMLDMLNTEKKITSRIGVLPDAYSFTKQSFEFDEPDIGRIIFGSSEYVKDGLLSLTEWLGVSPWSERMIEILDAIWENAPFETEFGTIVSDDVEVIGEMLQTLSRIYFMTGDEKYLDWAIRMGDYYLLGNHHITRDLTVLKLRDHGCEIVSGLCELYAAVAYAKPEKREEYKKPIHEMLDRILEVGRNEDGLFYGAINPVSGQVIKTHHPLTDSFGYTLNGFYTVYLLDSVERYREATIKALSVLKSKYTRYCWEDWSGTGGINGTGFHDGYADAIEGVLNLYAREPVSSAADWMDTEIHEMWAKQKESGVPEGGHGDGNFARTSIMYSLWKTQGLQTQPWISGLKLGAVPKQDSLYISISADFDWKGALILDVERHKEIMNLPFDWPRINQYPEYFTRKSDKMYKLIDIETGKKTVYKGSEIINGIELSVKAGTESRLILIEQ